MPKCLKCNGSVFEIKNSRFESKIKKQIIEVIVPCNICQKCQAPLMNNEQMNHLRRVAADRYREMNYLLTSKEIISYREKLGLSQIAFARFLNIGEASIKRWETYYIQDSSQDDHIRLKCDSLYSEMNCFYLQCKYMDVNIYSGLRAFSTPRVKEVFQFFEQVHPKCSECLRKLCFYTDFLHFKRYNRCITGMRYVPLKSGPAPSNYNQLIHFVQSDLYNSSKICNFDDDEKKTIADVSNLFLQDSGQIICELSRKEKGYLETDDADFISYQYAKDLLIC